MDLLGCITYAYNYFVQRNENKKQKMKLLKDFGIDL